MRRLEHQLQQLAGGALPTRPLRDQVHLAAHLGHRVGGARREPGHAQGGQIIHVVSHVGAGGRGDTELAAELQEPGALLAAALKHAGQLELGGAHLDHG